METVGRGDIDGVDSGIRRQLFITVIALVSAVGGGEAGGAGDVPGCNGFEAGIASQREGGSELGRDLSRADDPPIILFQGW